jgi:hypothetical protein
LVIFVTDYRESWDIRSINGSLCFASAIYARLVGGDQDEPELLWLAEYLRVNSAALAQPEPVGPTEHDIAELAEDIEWKQLPQDEATRPSFLLEFARAVLARWGRPTIKPVPASERLPGCVRERFEFSVFDSEYEEQAGGIAPTYAQALSEGQHYLAMYSQDGPHSLELRRVEVLIPDALPVPTTH